MPPTPLHNPLSAAAAQTDDDDAPLVALAVDGDRDALERLIKRHQPFIYNVAWKMVHDPDDALDLTQEVLIKVITKLAQFDGRSAFRTWLYRIVVNEFLQAKRRSREGMFTSFDEHAASLDALPNPEPTAEEELVLAEASREMAMACTSGMILCLTREQRLTYLLGDTFGVDHKLGAELFGISPANFRVRLHRARRELYNYMNGKCGLVNRANPCRCPKKAKALRQAGRLDPEGFQFARGYRREIADFVARTHEQAAGRIHEALDDARGDAAGGPVAEYTALFRGHAAREDFGGETVIGELLDYFEV